MFDEIHKISCDGTEVEYGYILGSSKILYIKAGMGGSYIGYENKYLKIAHRINEKYGFSVICVSNPAPLPIIVDKTILGRFIKEHHVQNPEMFFFGHSNGCIKGLELGADGIPFIKMVLVNMPLMINFHKTVHWINSMPNTDIVTVYGEADPSYRYIPFLQIENSGNPEIIKVSGADHNFTGMIEQFIELSEKIL